LSSSSLARVNPISIFATAICGLLLGGPVATPVLLSAAWIVGLCLIFGTLTVSRYRRRA
jgi:hypothetical protein